MIDPAQCRLLQHLQQRRKYVLRVGAALCVAFILLTESSWRDSAPQAFAWLQRSGLLLILLCIFGRSWCILYIGGRKKRELISEGPYSIVRNPLYVFTVVGIAGVGLFTGSVVGALVLATLTLFVFHVVVLQEEAFLANAFGERFAAYATRVPRFWPRWSAWQDADEVVTRPALVMRTFFHATFFLLVVPLVDLRDLLRQLDMLPVLLLLP